MFTLTDTPVKFIGLLILFAFTTIWSLRDLAQPQSTRQRVSNSLHLMMAVVMLAMVARSVWTPLSNLVPLPAWVVIFALATGWYGYLLVDATLARRAGRPAALGHAISHLLMFAAMTWHLAAMQVKHSMMGGHDHGDQGHGDHAHTDHGHAEHGHGMEDTMTPMVDASQAGSAMWWFAVIGIPFVVYLLGGAVVALVAAFAPAESTTAPPVAVTVGAPARTSSGTARGASGEPVSAPPVGATCHEARPVGSAVYRLGQVSHFAMLFGMFWMSTGLLTPIAPFMAALAF